MIAIYLYLLCGLILKMPTLCSAEFYREIELIKFKYRDTFDYSKHSDQFLVHLAILLGVIVSIIIAPINFFIK